MVKHVVKEIKIRAVLFDLGETLLDFGRFSTTRIFRAGARASHAYLRSLGQRVGPFEWYCWKNLLILRLRVLVSSITGNDFDAFALLQRVGRRRGITLTDEQWREFAWRWYEPLGRLGRVQPDTPSALAVLRDAGLKLGIVSNTFVNRESLERHMEQFGILEYFPVRVYSYEHPRRKPYPGIFQRAAELVGEPFERIAFVGDRIDKDILPALRLGMTAILKTAYTNAGKSPPRGVHRITHLADLPVLIDELNAAAACCG